MSQSHPGPGTAIDLDVLAQQLRAHGHEAKGPLSAAPITGGRSNLTFHVTDGASDWVLRRPPIAGLTPSAHDVGREYAVLEALQHTGVPVPATVLSCPDPTVMGAPFTVVQFVPGRVLRTRSDVTQLRDCEVAAAHEELVRVLARLHAVDFRRVGLENLGRPHGYVRRQVSLWARQWDLVATRELDDVPRLHARLEQRLQTLPVGNHAGIVHGDYRIDNTLIALDDPGRILAVVDWEMATVGDPLTDLAMLCVYQHPAFDHVVGEPAASSSSRWPGPGQIAQDYAVESGADLADLDFYLGLGYLKLAVISEGIYSRYLAGAGMGPGYATAGLAVADLVTEGLRVLGGRR